MSNSIKLSPKHGVNPSIGVCFFCGRETGELALMGRMRKTKSVRTAWGGQSTVVEDNDVEAPHHSVLSYQPCDACRSEWAPGVACIGVSAVQPSDGRPPIQKQDGKSLYPTGSLVVMTPEAVSRIFQMDMAAGSITLMDDELVRHLIDCQQKASTEDSEEEPAPGNG